MSVRVQLSELQDVNQPLYNKIAAMIRRKGADISKVASLIVNQTEGYVDPEMQELQHFVATEAAKRALTPDIVPDTPTPAVKEPAYDELYQEELRQSRERRAAQLKREQDAAAADEFWLAQTQAGLIIDSEKNRQLVGSYLTANNLQPSVDTVKAALAALAGQLDQPEVLLQLADGSKQLPLNADVYTMKRATPTQLRDLSKRRGEGRSRASGGFGSRF